MFKIPELLYSYDALEPYIDAQTMEIHLTKHHQAYVDNLNKALSGYPELQNKTLEQLVLHIDELPQEIQIQVKNNGGGHYNHSLFWKMMKPQGSELKGLLLTDIQKRFVHIDAFIEKFETAAKSRFGSGWVWLVVNRDGDLDIVSMPNQDAPLTGDTKPILGLDIWEHAYYLKYQNRRPDYIKAWWNVVNWDYVQDSYLDILGK